MFNPTALYFITTPIDMRAGVSRLASHVQRYYPDTWQNGTLFIFINRPRTMLKLITVDSHGLWLCQRKLHQRSFPKIQTDQTELTLTPAQFSWLCKGISFQQVEGIKQLPESLPRVERVIDLDDKSCKHCQAEMKFIGDAISEKLNYIPAVINVTRTIRKKYRLCPLKSLTRVLFQQIAF